MTLTKDSLFAPPILPEIIPNPQAENGFDWPIPENANIAELCCDRWARTQPQRIALTYIDKGWCTP